nr:sulfatase-like hydrolase/transferase [Pirellulaceae bacterium]
MKRTGRTRTAKWLASVAGLLLAFAGFAAARPNIVFFLVDDMGWQETSVPFHSEVTELNRRYRTPNMERLAAQGMKFTQAYASAVCSPTRVSALTGMNVARHRVTNWTLRKNASPDNPHKTLQPPDWNLNGVCTNSGIERTMQVTPLPVLLRSAGYRTIHVGKAHFGAKDTPGENPLNLGFDINIAGHAAGGPGSYWGEKDFSAAWRTKPPDTIWDVPGLEAYHGQDIFLTEALTREAIKAVERAVADQEPFYLYLAHYAIHAPWEKDDRFYQKYLAAGLKPLEATLASMIEGMDKSLGDVMATLERLGVAENTIILFMSDNGSPSQCPPNLPLRGHKLTPYEGGICEPMIVKWPGVTKPASVCREPVVIEDFFPTILELAGAEWRGRTLQTVDGISFVPFLKGGAPSAADRAFLWHFPHNYGGQGPFSAIRQGPWKLIYHHADRRLELFNIDDDISETRDLAKDHPTKVTALARLLAERLREENALMPRDKVTGKTVEFPDALPAMTDVPQKRPPRGPEETEPAYEADVWLLGGQSNMQGTAKIADLPGDIPHLIPHAWFWNGSDFEPLELGKTRTSARPGEFGPEIGFALDMATADRPVYLIKYYASGMPLHHGWGGNQWLGGEPQPGRRNFYPGERADDPNQGTLYREMTAQFQAGVRRLRQQSRKPDIRGFLWMQGEQDSKHPDSATSYAASLRRLRQRLAADLETAPDLPLAFGQALPYEPALPRFTNRTELRAQMAAADMDSGRPEAMPRTKMVSTDGFGQADDTVHYNADGQLRLGRGFAAAMKVIAAKGKDGGASRQPPAKVPRSAIAERLEWQGVAIEEPDYTIWGASPILAAGKVHLFVARWPEANVDPAWRKSSEIARYVAEKPEGPFRFQEVVLQGNGRMGGWDAFAPHNPEIQRFGGTFALCYIANSDFHQPPHPLNQQIGMVVSESVNGPWKKVGNDGRILGPSSDPHHFTHGRQVVNPALLKVGDKFHLYFKTTGKVRGTTVYGLAVADQVTGSYRMLDQPLTSNDGFIEDGSAFLWDGRVFLLTTDNHGKVTGVRGGGALWVSDDGVHFKSEWTQL